MYIESVTVWRTCHSWYLRHFVVNCHKTLSNYGNLYFLLFMVNYIYVLAHFFPTVMEVMAIFIIRIVRTEESIATENRKQECQFPAVLVLLVFFYSWSWTALGLMFPLFWAKKKINSRFYQSTFFLCRFRST